MAADEVEIFSEQVREMTRVLQASGELTLSITASDFGRKALLLAAASRFERDVTGLLETFSGAEDPRLGHFVRNKALKRQFHSLFNWTANNVNQFLGLFGPDFKEVKAAEIQADPMLSASIRNFLDLGHQRNSLVHGDYVSAPLEHTTDELLEMYRSASEFVGWLEQALLGEAAEGSKHASPESIGLPN